MRIKEIGLLSLYFTVAVITSIIPVLAPLYFLYTASMFVLLGIRKAVIVYVVTVFMDLLRPEYVFMLEGEMLYVTATSILLLILVYIIFSRLVLYQRLKRFKV